MITEEDLTENSDTESIGSNISEVEKNSKIWHFCCLIISVIRLALFVLCLGTCFVIFVIFTHEDKSGFQEHPAAIEFCPSEQNKPNVIEVESKAQPSQSMALTKL